MNRTLFEISDKVEEMSVQMERALAIHGEVIEYFAVPLKHGTLEAENLIASARHIELLMHATEYLLQGIFSDMIQTAKDILNATQGGVE